MATVEELKEMVVDLKANLINAKVPDGHCPYAYYPGIKSNVECGELSCREHRKAFLEDVRKVIVEEVSKL